MAVGMSLFHVYVEAPDRSPAAVERLAEAIARKYGVPAVELSKRLAQGKFRVKANVDRATAESYKAALLESGARVEIEPATATPVAGTPIEAAATPASGPVARTPAQLVSRSGTTTPPALAAPTLAPTAAGRPANLSLPPLNVGKPASTTLPPANAPRPSSSSLPPANAAKSAPAIQSGLSAAYTDSAGTSDLGALGEGSLSLASLDGNDEGSPLPDAAFGPAEGLSATIGPAMAPANAPASKPGAAKPGKPKDVPLDLFAPPEAESDAAFQVELATDEVEHRARKMSTPPAAVPVAPPVAPAPAPAGSPASAARRLATPAAGAPIVVAPGADGDEMPRGRFAAGVMLSILIGFIPAHLIASSRESSAFAKIDAQINDTQTQADTPETYAALDGFRAAQLARKASEKRSIALQSMVIWAVLGGGIAYVWFRRIPWDRAASRA